MTPEQLELLRQTIDKQLKAGIETHVNGKIRVLTERFETYVKEDNEWKERANPTIELGNNVRGFGIVLVYLLGVAGAIFGVIKFLIPKL